MENLISNDILFFRNWNSYQVAKLLAYLTQDKMQDISTVKDYKHDDSVMGFVFPVHCYDVLDLMQDFIKN